MSVTPHLPICGFLSLQERISMRSFCKWRSVFAVLIAVSLIHAQAVKPRRIAVFGSSVAFGTGDEFNKEGYTGLLRELLAPRGWEVFNQSRPGDSTITMAPRWSPPVGGSTGNTRFLTTVNPNYVVIGLSFGNEGLYEANTTEEKDAIFNQYADGIRKFVEKARSNNITPIVTLVYPRSVYSPIDYQYVRRMNILQNTWDVPTVNFLGAIDDGAGHWASGFEYNDKHPNAMGHRELAMTFVPTLFEALEKGKPSPARPASPSSVDGFARITQGQAALTFTPDSTMHPFAMSMMVRAQGNSAVATIQGSILNVATDEMKGAGNSQFREITLASGQPFTSTVGVREGRWSYTASNGSNVGSFINADNEWHHIVVSHYAARGETLFFVDGKLAGKVAERLEPKKFALGGPGSSEFKDLYIYRSALNADEVAAIHDGTLLQASLEIFAPLNDAEFKAGAAVENRAQSLSELKVGAGSIVHMADTAK
jgi:lysophospholipase L1-like esterase